jgi:hypothetical protein
MGGASVFDLAVPVEYLPDTGYKFLIFGMSGSGKTTLACGFPKPLLLVRPEEVEDGSRSVRGVKGVHVTPNLTHPDQLADICAGQRHTRRYRTIVLDGVTRLQDMAIKKHMGLADVPVQMTWGIVPQADWNRIGISMKEMLRDLLRLTDDGTHVVVVGGERTLGDDSSNEVAVPTVMVALSPSITGFVHEVCDYNVHTFKRKGYELASSTIGGKQVQVKKATGKVEFCLHVGPSDIYATKFRCDRNFKLPDVLINPSFSKLDRLARGESSDHSAPQQTPSGDESSQPAQRPLSRSKPAAQRTPAPQ